MPSVFYVGEVSLNEVWTHFLQSPFVNSQLEILSIKDQCQLPISVNVYLSMCVCFILAYSGFVGIRFCLASLTHRQHA